ncbi:MAG: class I SAM-dependent methyltransferase [Fuerstiella sp.]|nr:class I SAM-dependent methyltransferase [Fuerstiella sp.]
MSIQKAVDLVLCVPVWLAAMLLKMLRRKGIGGFGRCRQMLDAAGVFPLIDHYYDPYVRTSEVEKGLDTCRALPGINWNQDRQLAELVTLNYSSELREFPMDPTGTSDPEFYFNNPMFGPGSADVYYSLIRKYKPRKIVEIGCGRSTIMAQKAIAQNQKDDPSKSSAHVCIEPFEQPWLESLPVELLRTKVESLGVDFFDDLQSGDILFIDSSHTIRPGGDVLHEYLEILPRLRQGVLIHIHDIFSPQDYPVSWFDQGVLWQEQYLVEAFLSFNNRFEIVLALNWLHINHGPELRGCCPSLHNAPKSDRGPSSLWLQRS